MCLQALPPGPKEPYVVRSCNALGGTVPIKSTLYLDLSERCVDSDPEVDPQQDGQNKEHYTGHDHGCFATDGYDKGDDEHHAGRSIYFF